MAKAIPSGMYRVRVEQRFGGKWAYTITNPSVRGTRVLTYEKAGFKTRADAIKHARKSRHQMMANYRAIVG